eukprot:GHVT01047424.1.p1 GENE.GHVT01047424.1~~GHVT01047424.1.p1  ORF type:complete len:805 (-),score=78.79 GHVT01047424.1:223-2637(-)
MDSDEESELQRLRGSRSHQVAHDAATVQLSVGAVPGASNRVAAPVAFEGKGSQGDAEDAEDTLNSGNSEDDSSGPKPLLPSSARIRTSYAASESAETEEKGNYPAIQTGSTATAFRSSTSSRRAAARESDDGDSEGETENDSETSMAMMGLPSAFGQTWRATGQLRQIAQKREGNRGAQMTVGPRKPQAAIEKSSDGPTTLPSESTNTTSYPGGKRSKESSTFSSLSGSSSALPSMYEVSVSCHSGKGVTGLCLNPKGSRMATGGYDSHVRLYDFNGMTTAMRSFRDLEPNPGHGISGLEFSCTGSHLLTAAGDAICRIFDTEGRPVQQTVKGDIYIRDMGNTKGHTHMITECHFHPFDREVFCTSSLDGTVRLWSLESKLYGVDQAIPHLHCLKATDDRNVNSPHCQVATCAIAPQTAKFIIGGGSDGSLQLWNERRIYGKPDKKIKQAHHSPAASGGSSVTDIRIFQDEKRLVSRGLDDRVKLWDLRMFQKPIHTWTKGLEGVHSKAPIVVSPDEKYIVAGTQLSVSGSTSASLAVLSTSVPYGEKERICLPGVRQVTRLAWPSSLNQVLVGCNDGKVQILYDPAVSQKGALLFIDKAPSRTQVDDADETEGGMLTFKAPIFTPDNLPPGYKETRSGDLRKVKPRGREKERIERETMKTIVPPRPGGKDSTATSIATHGRMTHFIMAQLAAQDTQSNPDVAKQDAVSILRGYAEKTTDDPQLIATAYAKTQPKAVLDYDLEDDVENTLGTGTRCPRCGLFLCQCDYKSKESQLLEQQLHDVAGETKRKIDREESARKEIKLK